MSDSSDNPKYKWTPDSTSLLISVWSDKQVQKQLEYATKPQLIWESVARYMRKKGYNVSAKQCRSRMKQVLVCYREAKRAGTREGVEQFYETIDRVLRNKQMQRTGNNGIDTVDSGINVKSPPKDVKTNKNLQMRHRFQEPVQSLLRTEALSPTWALERDPEYPESPESNETVIARPYNALSATRDAAINTVHQQAQLGGRNILINPTLTEEPVREEYRQNLLGNYPYGDVPFQNTVQNVQNQIIQENMLQHQNLQQNNAWNYIPQQNLPSNNRVFCQNMHNMNYGMRPQNPLYDPGHPDGVSAQNPNLENMLRQQNQVQQNIIANNRAMPQEPRKVVFGQNLAATYKQYRNVPPPRLPLNMDMQNGSLSPNDSPNVSQNLNDAFCESKNGTKTHDLNETFTHPISMGNLVFPNTETTVLTNNATCNDDSLLQEFMLDSPTLSEIGCRSKDSAVNTENVPNAPLRKKKAQKLEQLVISAINSQNEVVNKILAAQNDMVSRFLDVDRDRQNRLENRLDHLLNVVHATVLNKTPESMPEIPPPPPEPVITSLVPPPKPGIVPPKLDLVPPKPCRVPCTVANANIELVNQNPVSTRPGVVSPITSPQKKPGTIWTKLGPVSQSPFVKAQQRLGLQPITNTETRTQSSAERRIAREVGKMNVDVETLIFETSKFLEMERRLEEKIENARLENCIGQSLNARRKLFTQREPTPMMILTAAFLEAECRACEQLMEPYIPLYKLREMKDDLLAGQGESYERLRRLNIHSNNYINEPCESSTPAKTLPCYKNNERYEEVPRQTIQQLAQLVMNSARWRDAASQNQSHNRRSEPIVVHENKGETAFNITFTAPKSVPHSQEEQNYKLQRDNQGKTVSWDKNVISDGPTNERKTLYSEPVIQQKPRFPMGFTTSMLDKQGPKERGICPTFDAETIGFIENVLPEGKQNLRLMDEPLAELQRMYLERNAEEQRRAENPPIMRSNGSAIPPQNEEVMKKLIHDIFQKKSLKDKDTDSENDEDFLDTTGTIHPPVIIRRGSLTSTGTASTDNTAHSTKFNKLDPHNCVIS